MLPEPGHAVIVKGDTNSHADGLALRVLAARDRFPERPALFVDGEHWAYGALVDCAGRMASFLQKAPKGRLGAILGARSLTAYSGVLATAFAGRGYVPLNPKYPIERTMVMLEACGANTLIVDKRAIHHLDAILSQISWPLWVLLPEEDDVAPIASRHPRHTVVGRKDIEDARPLLDAHRVQADDIAYLLFTSGSTGAPKGVMVSSGNVLHHLDVMAERYSIRETDRFSQSFELTFDLSVFDMFLCWTNGACLYSLPEREVSMPARFIREHGLTVWFSVPSTGMMLRRLHLLKASAFPTLRVSLFCGERLMSEIAAAWQEAAPGSIVENLYGPTETTIACTLYRWDPSGSPAECVDGTVPIGAAFPGLRAAIVDDLLSPVQQGGRGELCISGPQVALGYWRDPPRTAERFVKLSWDPTPDARWYRTGDVAFVNDKGNLIFCGRGDEQIKLRGYRVELGEVEFALRQAAKTDFVAVLPYPIGPSGPAALTACVAGTDELASNILNRAKEILPPHCVPQSVIKFDQLPLTSSGKIHRLCLKRMLEEKDAKT